MSEQESPQNRRLVQGSMTSVWVGLIITIAVLANLIASQLFVRVDMTDDKIYTLSDVSQDLVRGLDEPVEVRIFLSPDLPPPLHMLPENVSDMMTEYEAASGGKLRFQIFSPRDGDKRAEETAAGYGCEKVAVGQQTETRVSLRAVFKCVAFIQGDKTEVIEDLRVSGRPESDNLEYEFTRALVNLTTQRSRRIGFVSGYGGPAGREAFMQDIEEVFSRLYGELLAPELVDLSQPDAMIPEELDALVLLDPIGEFTPRAKFEIDQFLQRGGSVGWYQSASTVDRGMLQRLTGAHADDQLPDVRRRVDNGLFELFAHYGVEHRRDMVSDPAHPTQGYVMSQQGVAQTSNPAVFQVVDIDRRVPFLSTAPPITLPMPSSLVLSDALSSNDEVKIRRALQTSEQAVRRPEVPTIRNYENVMLLPPGAPRGKELLAVTVNGPLPSFYENNPLPRGVSEDDMWRGERRAGRLFVIGTGEFLGPMHDIGYDEQAVGIGQAIFFSSLEWLAQDSSMSRIRDKRRPRLIGEVPEETQRSVLFVNIAFVPACFALIGAFMMRRRRRRRANLEL